RWRVSVAAVGGHRQRWRVNRGDTSDHPQRWRVSVVAAGGHLQRWRVNRALLV
ncbi:TPA: hypothetical protein IF294_000264, partial [Escherichia coli]|nr:hypothetical protein [Escherichia coli]